MSKNNKSNTPKTFKQNIMSSDKSIFYNAFYSFLQLLKMEKKDIGAVYTFSIFSGLLFLALPLGIQSIVGFVMAGELSTSIIVLIIAVLIALFINGFLQIKQLEIIEKIEQKIFARYALAYTETLPQMHLEKMDNYYLPELVNRFFDVSTLQKSIYKLLLDVPAAIVQIIFGTILLSFYHPFFIGFGILLLSLVVLIIWRTSAKGLATSIETSNYKYETGAWIEEIAQNIKTFKFNKSSNFHLTKTNQILSGYLQNKSNHFRILKIQYWSVIFFKLIITTSMLILGVNLLINQQINIGQFIAADIVIIAIINSVEKFIGNFDILYDALTAIQKLDKVTLAETEQNGTLIYQPKDNSMKVDFENVSFSYTNQFHILSNFSLHIKKGEWIQIVGNKGTGKSSIVNLLSGAYKNFNGKILIDDIPIGNYELTSLRDQMGVLLQQNNIFKASLLENITYSKSYKDQHQVMKIAHFTGLTELIQSYKEGLDLAIDPQYKRLAPSYVHAILLSRALYNSPTLLLLEDPFIYMQEDEIKAITSYIKTELKSTVIIINNLETLNQYCDRTINVN
jgi:ATP-binding cassette, subfamily B, bacterial